MTFPSPDRQLVADALEHIRLTAPLHAELQEDGIIWPFFEEELDKVVDFCMTSREHTANTIGLLCTALAAGVSGRPPDERADAIRMLIEWIGEGILSDYPDE